MKRPIIQIKTPCSENPSNFFPTKTGGFCYSCQKDVVDFRKMSKDEVLTFIQQNPQNKCGIFRPEHLSIEPTKKSPRRLGPLWILATLGFLGLSLPAQSQTHEPTKTEQNQKLADIGLVKELVDTSRMIKGKIFSGDDKQTLPGVRVYLKGTELFVETDANGEFEFEIPASYKKRKIVLLMSFIGFYTVEKKIKVKDLPVKLEDTYLSMDTTPLGPYGVIYPKTSSWRSFLGFFGFEKGTEQIS
ncbi:carboxypeptidase-like regulatory domain-containing protein [Algoriphagus namhaensis]